MGSAIGLSIQFKGRGGFMRNPNRAPFVAVALSILFAPSPSMAATGVADQAAAIVVGEVASGRQTGNVAVFTLSVIRTLKGDVSPGTSITVSAALQQPGNRDLAGGYGMWLLRKAGSQWVLLPVQSSFFDTAYYPLSKRASPAMIPTNSRASAPDDQITLELAAALQSDSSNPLQFHLLASGLLSAADSPLTQEVFQFLRSGSDPELKFIGLARSLRNKADTSALAEVANSVDLTHRLKATFYLIPGVLGRLDSDPTAIGYLGRIATSSHLELQRAAATALMHVHTRDTLPFLANLLDSSDPTTREFAMRGLSSFVESLPIATQTNILTGRASLQQGPAPYRTPETDRYSLATRSLAQAPEGEAAFLQFWKTWWAIMKDKLAK